MRDWQLLITALFCAKGGNGPFALRELPAHLLPFFTYRDVAVYVTESQSLVKFFPAMYREWYPTRDRSVFNNGLLPDCGSPFFGSTMRVGFAEPIPKLPVLLKHLVCWHVALIYHLHSLLPHFCALRYGVHVLVRPGLKQQQLQDLPDFPYNEYPPIIQRSFAECFVWVEAGWDEKGVGLVVLDEHMLRRIMSHDCQGLTREVELEVQVKEMAGVEVDSEKHQRQKASDEHVGVDTEASMSHVSVWRGNREDVTRAVLAGDEKRKRGLREYNTKLREWLGEGVNVGK